MAKEFDHRFPLCSVPLRYFVLDAEILAGHLGAHCVPLLCKSDATATVRLPHVPGTESPLVGNSVYVRLTVLTKGDLSRESRARAIGISANPFQGNE